jgi:hypothetical protein
MVRLTVRLCRKTPDSRALLGSDLIFVDNRYLQQCGVANIS